MRNLLCAGLLAILPVTSALAQDAGSAPSVERVEVGNLVSEGVPPVPPELAKRLLQYENLRSASFASFLPGQSGIMIATRFGNTGQLHRVDAPMGMRRQVTFFAEPVTGASFPKTGAADRFLFEMDEGGSENDQIYLFDVRRGTDRMLTDGTGVNRGTLWANNSDRFAYTTTRRNGRDWDIHVMTVTADGDATTSAALESEGSWSPLDWSPDDSKLLVANYISANEEYLYVLDLTNGHLTKLNGEIAEPVAYSSPRFSPDGLGVFYATDHQSEFQQLHYHDLSMGVSKVLTDDIPWDVTQIDLSKDGRLLAFATNEGGIGKVRLLKPKTLAGSEVPLPPGVVFDIDLDDAGERLAVTISTANAPADVYIYTIADEKLTRWTESEVGGLPPETFVDADLIEYPTFDTVAENTQRRIPAFVFRPRTPGPWPVLIDIHGGPESQSRPWFNGETQFLAAELGVAVIKPNVRGSSGYGKTYLKLDNGRLREDSVKDIGALLDWIARQPEFDASRVMVNGGSYGGYMVLASMAHYSDRLRCGIDSVGISNFVTFLESTSEYRRDLRRVEYGDERDPDMREFLQSISPTTNAHKISRPLFVVQGLNDPRVPYTEAEQVVREVRSKGQEVWYLLAKDEGHGFAKKENRDTLRAAMMMFVQRHLLPPADESGK